MLKFSIRTFFLSVIVVSIFILSVHANPISIKSGRIVVDKVTQNININFGDKSNFSGVYEGTPLAPIGKIVQTGSQLSLNLNLLQNNSLNARIIDGDIFNDYVAAQAVYQPGNSFNLNASVLVPSFSGSVFTTTVPFTMQSHFSVSCIHSAGGCKGVFGSPDITGKTYDFNGNGTADITFGKDENGNVVLTSAVYNFSGTPQPTPEPATLILFGTGLAGVFGYAGKKLRGRTEN